MRSTNSCRHSKSSLATSVIIGFLLLVGSASISPAQSGRRPPKRPTSPDPLPPKQDEPPIQPSSDQAGKPKIPVKVVWHSSFVASSTIYSRTVLEACLDRLSKSGSVTATGSSGEMNRKQASDAAKASSDTYVVWFELEVDHAYDRGGMGNVPPQYLMVRFELYTPTTGKSKTGGNVYQRPQGPGGIPIPGPTSTSAFYSLGYAGREMADRVLDSLGILRR